MISLGTLRKTKQTLCFSGVLYSVRLKRLACNITVHFTVKQNLLPTIDIRPILVRAITFKMIIGGWAGSCL